MSTDRWLKEREREEEKLKQRHASDAVLNERRGVFLPKLQTALEALPGVTKVLLEVRPVDIYSGSTSKVWVHLNDSETTVEVRFKPATYEQWAPNAHRTDRIVIDGSYRVVDTKQFPEPKTGFVAERIAAAVWDNFSARVAYMEAYAARSDHNGEVDNAIAKLLVKYEVNPYSSGVSRKEGGIAVEYRVSIEQAEEFLKLAVKLGLAKPRDGAT